MSSATPSPRWPRSPAVRAACRQLASSGGRRIRGSQAPPPPTARHHGVVREFKGALEAGDVGTLVGLLDPGAKVTADGGGRVSATLHPVEGAEEIARYLAVLVRRPPTE